MEKMILLVMVLMVMVFLIVCSMENIKLYLKNKKMEKEHQAFIKKFNKKIKNDSIKNYWNNKKSLSFLVMNDESTYIARKALKNDLESIKYYSI